MRTASDTVSVWVGTATDIEDRRRAFEEQRYLVDASTVLGSSLDVQRTLSDVARLVDVAFAEEMARRISVAIDNARLYEDATLARAAAEALASDVIEQSKGVEIELLKMRGERDDARAKALGSSTT